MDKTDRQKIIESCGKSLNDLCLEAVETARKHGFYTEKMAIEGMIAYLALVSSEVSEAIEAIQRDDTITEREYLVDNVVKAAKVSPAQKVQFFETYFKDTLEDELADILIRVFSFCGAFKIDIDEAVRRKMEYNKERPTNRHGKKF